MSEHLRFPSPHGRARPGPGRPGSAAQPAGPAPAAPINAGNLILGGYGFSASRQGGRFQLPAAAPAVRGERGPGRARTMTTKRTISTPLYLHLPRRPEGWAARSPAAAGGAAAGSAAPGWHPRPAGSPGPRSPPRPPELRGALGLLGSAKGCEDGRAASPLLRTACGPPARLLPVRLLPARLLLPVGLLPTRLLPVTRLTVATCRPRSLSPPCPSPAPTTAGAGTCAAAPPPPCVWSGLLNGNRTKHRWPRPLHRPPAPIGRAGRPPNLDPLCHWPAARSGSAHKGPGGGLCPGRGRDAQLWCRVGWGARVGLQPPGGLAAARRCHWLGSARAEGRGAHGGEDALRARVWWRHRVPGLSCKGDAHPPPPFPHLPPLLPPFLPLPSGSWPPSCPCSFCSRPSCGFWCAGRCRPSACTVLVRILGKGFGSILCYQLFVRRIPRWKQLIPWSTIAKSYPNFEFFSYFYF